MRSWTPLTFALVALSVALPGAARAAELDEQSQVMLGLTRGTMSEQFLPQDVDVSVRQIERYFAQARFPLAPGNAFVARLNRCNYPLVDPDFPDAVHLRTETALMLGDELGGRVLGGYLSLAVGWSARAYETENTASAPGTAPAYLFVPFQLQHGPAAVVKYRRGLIGPLAFVFDVEWVPYAFTTLSTPNLHTFPWMMYYAAAPRFTLWDDKIALGYYYERSNGTTLNRESSGFLASITVAGL